MDERRGEAGRSVSCVHLDAVPGRWALSAMGSLTIRRPVYLSTDALGLNVGFSGCCLSFSSASLCRSPLKNFRVCPRLAAVWAFHVRAKP